MIKSIGRSVDFIDPTGRCTMKMRVSDFFYRGSPFWPDVDPAVVASIRKDLREDPTYYSGEAIAKHLIYVGVGTSAELLGRKVKVGRKRVLIGPREVGAYSKGFIAPIFLVQFSYMSVAHGLSAAEWAVANHPDIAANAELQSVLRPNLEYAADLLAQDTSGKLLIEDYVRKQSKRSSDLYYGVGLEAARRTFLAYCNRLGVR
jgi:hypothetical protein